MERGREWLCGVSICLVYKWSLLTTNFKNLYRLLVVRITRQRPEPKKYVLHVFEKYSNWFISRKCFIYKWIKWAYITLGSVKAPDPKNNQLLGVSLSAWIFLSIILYFFSNPVHFSCQSSVTRHPSVVENFAKNGEEWCEWTINNDIILLA